MNKNQEDRQYIKYWKPYLDNPEICTSKFPGKYCIEFRNFKAAEFFNSLEISKKLFDCENYLPSIIVKKNRDWDILELEDDEFYNCYPKYYGSSDESICLGKNFIKNSKPNYPFLVQNKIEGQEESYYILYVKKNNIVSAYYAPTITENKNGLIELFCNIQKFIIPKFDSKNYSEIEYLLTQFDIIEDKDNNFWIKGINWDPKFLHNWEKIVSDIYHHIYNSEFNYFLSLPLEKFVQTQRSNFSF